MNLRLHYVTPNYPNVFSTDVDVDLPGNESWVHSMVEANPDTIFFYTVETTDIFA